MPVHETSIKPSTKHITVDRRFAAILQEDFAIPAATVLEALVGEPQRQAIGICTWAVRTDDPAGALLAWAKKHRRGRCRRPWEIAPRPARDRRRHGPGRDIAAPRTVAPGRRDDVGVLDRIATRLGV